MLICKIILTILPWILSWNSVFCIPEMQLQTAGDCLTFPSKFVVPCLQLCHITLGYRLASVQAQGHFSNHAAHLSRANSRGCWMARSCTCSSSLLDTTSRQDCIWIGFCRRAYLVLMLSKFSYAASQKQVPLKHCSTARTTFSTAKAISHFCFSLNGHCSKRCMDPCLMTAIHILMQLHQDSLCQKQAFFFTDGPIQGDGMTAG